MTIVKSSLSSLEPDIFAGTTLKTSKISAILCIVIMFALGVSCHIHASPHTHGMPSGSHDDDHHDQNATSTIDDMACVVAVIPPIDRLLELSALHFDVSFPAVKPLVPVFEFHIPPRPSL